MTIPARSLSRLVSWTEILAALGVDIATPVLPAVVKCPCCSQEQLTVYPDGLSDVWLHCTACGLAGDIIELAARTRGLDIAATMSRLVQLKLVPPEKMLVPAKVQRYIAEHIDHRRNVNEFWSRCRGTLAHDHTYPTRHLVTQYTGLRHYTHSGWRGRGDQLLGASTRIEVEQLLYPGSTAYRARSGRAGHGAGRSQIFRGGGWDHLLVAPYYDLPGRIAAFLFIGRNADPNQGDIIFKRVLAFPPTQPFREAGLQMLDCLFSPPHQHLQDTLFIAADPAAALRLQLGHLRSYSLMLPLAGSYGDQRHQTTTMWSCLPLTARKIVFFSPQLDEHLIRQARAADGWVCTKRIGIRDLRNAPTFRTPVQWLQYAERNSMHWTLALREIVRRLPLHHAEALLLKIGIPWAELREFIVSCDQSLRERLEPLLAGRAFTPRVRVEGKMIVELDEGWYQVPQNELISNAKLRIDESLQTEAGRTYYRGHVRFGGEAVPFTEDAAVIERDAFAWMKRFLLQAGKGIPICQPSWSRRALPLALQLHPPSHAAGVDRVGWSRDRWRFEFPRFAIHLGGQIDLDHRLLPTGETPPATDLCEPRILFPNDLDALGAETYEMAIFWAMAACVVNNLAARAMSHQPSGIALAGPAAQTAGRAAAKLLGCVEFRMPQRMPVNGLLDKLRGACNRHDWPTTLVAPDRQPAWVRRAWLTDPEPKNCIVAVETCTAEVLAIQRGWNTIRCGREASGLQQLHHAGPKVVPAYLQDLASRRLNYLTPGSCRTINFLKDLADWFERSDGNPQAVLDGMKVLMGDGQQPAWWSFAEIVSQFMLDKLVENAFVSLRHFGPTIVGNITMDTDRGEVKATWLPQKPITDIVKEQCGLKLDAGAVTNSLKADGLLLAERPYRGEMGWVVESRSWWQRMVCTLTESQQRNYFQPDEDLDNEYLENHRPADLSDCVAT